jgi:aminopeptidase N
MSSPIKMMKRKAFVHDSSSLSNPESWKTESLHFDLKVDFDGHRLVGSVLLNVRQGSVGADTLVLDTQQLDIEEVLVDGAPATWEMGPTHKLFGTPLRVKMPPAPRVRSYAQVCLCVCV